LDRCWKELKRLEERKGTMRIYSSVVESSVGPEHLERHSKHRERAHFWVIPFFQDFGTPYLSPFIHAGKNWKKGQGEE
jgi:hypothetical protein